ncbi:ankyrin repeat domain-containing protein [Sulfurimonas sp.]|uniref:ankyrin repeat domain-containing protein n=1 Tax=Sulfurimonas sp. TaxID=2022749 RepID=UPI002B45DCE3|nr:ankyrin repeat domain-containing protein [Sulfurimonas sp.]
MRFINIVFLQVIFVLSMVHADTKIYYGHIQEYPITMELSLKDDKTVTGYYFYDKYKKKINLWGSFDNNLITTYVKDKKMNITETFEGRFSGKQIIGSWKQKKTTLPFEVSLEKEVDIFEDSKITCSEMKSYPNLVFGSKYGIDLGSGRGSPTSVDYSCEGGLGSLTFLKDIYNLSEAIRSEAYGSVCSGSIVYAHARYYEFGLLKAGLAPDILKKQLITPNETEIVKNTKKYFTLWAYQSLYNFSLFEEYWHMHDKAFPLLSKHFEKTFSFTKEEANSYTKYALREFLFRAAGSFSSYILESNPYIGSLIETIANPKNSSKELDEELLKKFSQKELDYGLKIAILNKKDNSYIKKLLKKGAIINTGDESALFFALQNTNQFTFLLEQGADINYKNSFGKSVLYYAIGFSNLELIKIMIENGANINDTYIDSKTRDKSMYDGEVFYKTHCSLKHTKRTPLMHASQNSDVAILKYLISHGANKHAVDEMNYNALDYAHMGKLKENIEFVKSIGLTTKRSYWE